MARRLKQTVDYFPHFVAKGKTLTILQNRFGIKGYAFWFKLLEALCSSDNISLNWDNAIEREYFTADAGVSVQEAEIIIEILVNLEQIDADLWHEKHLIWCQNLVDNLADVWAKRRQKTPEKPIVDNFISGTKTCKNATSAVPKCIKTTHSCIKSGISGPEIPQSKVKESKVEESKLVKKVQNPTDLPTPPKLLITSVSQKESENADNSQIEPTDTQVPLQDIKTLLLAYAEAKNIRLTSNKERKAYIDSSPFFYQAKNLIKATNSLSKAKEAINTMAERYKAKNKPSWGLDWVLKDFWECQNSNLVSSLPPKQKNNIMHCSHCGLPVGSVTVRVQITEKENIEVADFSRCPKCGQQYQIKLLPDFTLLKISLERFKNILKKSGIESFTQTQWAKWLELVPDQPVELKL